MINIANPIRSYMSPTTILYIKFTKWHIILAFSDSYANLKSVPHVYYFNWFLIKVQNTVINNLKIYGYSDK